MGYGFVRFSRFRLLSFRLGLLAANGMEDDGLTLTLAGWRLLQGFPAVRSPMLM